ncbi:unnamed protein product, partial [Anisakis simplex]|uniref:tRNA N(3)-methylcytidine methyltransferase n=1 Tax=Anisakis simplex TaxID=6269 RepID=A0A0M3JZ03_ANISI
MSSDECQTCRTPRALTSDEINKLNSEIAVNEFKKNRLEIEAQKNWDRFYKRNKDKFFKDRHWSREDFITLCPHINLESELTYLEAGCGVGNMLFPLMDYFPLWNVVAFDFSSNAIQLLIERFKQTKQQTNSLTVFVADLCDTEHFPPVQLPLSDSTSTRDAAITRNDQDSKSTLSSSQTFVSEPLSSESPSISRSQDDCIRSDHEDNTSNQFRNIVSIQHAHRSDHSSPSTHSECIQLSQSNPSDHPSESFCYYSHKSVHFNGADLATLIFVLSAIHPNKHRIAVQNLTKLIKKGGTVIVRDYGINDHAMIRFGRGTKLHERFYARQDGTRAFYFKLGLFTYLFFI